MSYTFAWVPTPGQDNGFVNGGGKARVILDSTQNSFISNPYNTPLYICIPPNTFQGGNAGAATLYDFAKILATTGPTFTVQNPPVSYTGKRLSGGNFKLNGNSCGDYEYSVLSGGTTLTQSMVATLFSSTQDSVSSWIVCKGNLTIPTNTYLIPTTNASYTPPSTATYPYPPDPNALRKLFMVVYVTGNLTMADTSSTVSMTACGPNTDTTGANIASINIPVANNLKNRGSTYSPVIQATGAAGGAAYTTGPNNYNIGSSWPGVSYNVLTTGGGSSGRMATSGTTGAGGAGSCFSGGTGGGGNGTGGTALAGSSRGGAGGSTTNGSGGTGSPGGTGSTLTGNNGTGGVLIVICEGTIINSDTLHVGTFTANGVSGTGGADSGGSSGGGISLVIQSVGSELYYMYANGGYVLDGTVMGAGSGVAAGFGINSYP